MHILQIAGAASGVIFLLGAAAPQSSTPRHARGTFEVKLTALPLADAAADKTLARLSSEKTFHGDIDATSRGEMLSAGTPASGSAGYVAIERVTGTIAGRAGSFVLQHSATMAHGSQQLTISVVPDSGTGQLTGLTGTMTIRIVNGQHFYDFEYTFGAAH